MKKILSAILLVASLSSFSIDPGVNEKVLASFNKSFANAQEVNWTETPMHYEVQFKQEDVRSSITYDKDGNILRTLRYYKEDKLPMFVLLKVQSRFPGKKIYGVTEESTDVETSYHITLEDDAHWYNVKADPLGFVTLEQKFKKA